MKFFLVTFFAVTALAITSLEGGLIGDIVDEVKDVTNPLLGDKGDEPSDDGLQTDLGNDLREEFDKLLEQIKDAIEQGKVVKEEYIKKAAELRKKLKDMSVDISEKAKDLLNQIRSKATDYLKEILERLGLL